MRKKETTEDPLAESPPPSKDTFVLTPEVENVSINHELLKQITEHSKKAFPREAIGLLDGKMEKPGEIVIGKIFFVTVGEEYSVAFSDEDFKVFEDTEFCVGWWHSHPGFGLFLSATDINTHILSFQITQPHSVALVVDPTNLDSNGLAIHRFFQVIGNSEDNNFNYKEVCSYITP
ncbi:MAG: Mov34/MPN/PAD-1 family protein [Candidatus Hodarchaeales archaeon]|jgi:26S proteasome regulatory subunit N11